MAGFSESILCILVVDEDVETLRDYGLHLGRLVHTVHQARSGAHALEQIAVLHPDLVFLDLGMPGIDGFEVANRIRSEPRLFFFSSRRRHTRSLRDWSSDVCSSD